jgi:hypothetical protein|nr:MAG TPA: hypothetical protein [Caudoviricetes sp.]
MNAALMHAATNLLQDPEEQYSTGCNAEDTPTVVTRTWHHTAMSVATFTLSALLAYVATEAIYKRIRGRN